MKDTILDPKFRSLMVKMGYTASDMRYIYLLGDYDQA